MNKLYIGGFLICMTTATLAGGYEFALSRAQGKLQTALDSMRANLGPSGSLTYKNPTVHLLTRSATLYDVAITTSLGTKLTADHLVMSPNGPGHMSILHADGVTKSSMSGLLNISSLDATNIDFVPFPAGQPFVLNPQAVAFDKAVLKNVVASSGRNRIGVDQVELDHYGSGRSSIAVLSGVTSDIKGLDYADHLRLADAQFSGVDLAAMASSINNSSDVSSVARGLVELDVTGLTLSLDNADKARIGSVVIKGNQGVAGAPITQYFAVNDIDIAPVNTVQQDILRKVGVERIKGHMFFNTSYSISDGIFKLSPLDVDLDKVGEFRIDLDVEHLDIAHLINGSNPVSSGIQFISGARFTSARMEFVDGGLREYILDKDAKSSGKSIDAIVADGTNNIANDPMLSSMDGSQAIKTALISFLQKSGTITMQVHPRTPLGITDILGLQTENHTHVLGQLGLEVTSAPVMLAKPSEK